MDLALFDFDGTITTKGTYPGFLRFAVPRARQLAGGLALSPLIVGYHCGLVSDEAIRPPMSRVAFRGADAASVRRLGERYAREVLPPLIRQEAIARLAWHRSRGDQVVVVSASLDAYLEPWCRAEGIEVICTRLEVRDGRLTGRYLEGDCCGAEKARRVRERYTLAAFGETYAYGDTEEDRQMLDLADHRVFRWRAL